MSNNIIFQIDLLFPYKTVYFFFIIKSIVALYNQNTTNGPNYPIF